jgi:hypothetical protein
MLFHGSHNFTMFRSIRPYLVLHDRPPRFFIIATSSRRSQ